ncbi:aminopeptidase [Lujinxingia litoralis]|uniref:Aminopeptidase n=1 Tax=Lujinxingia litoralis TaxID=2211119 RepID=A0A328C826_9DELT|nr:DUF4910 domain-containing protein [Lujinxingia litoralis]RAL20738.1 aminopeptidase [Lujinxingia litoralis]
MYQWARELYPMCRSLTGEGTRQTLRFLQERLPGMRLVEVPSGTRAFDWEVPLEWNIRGAQIRDMSGRVLVDFADHNLHVMGYSEPICARVSREKLEHHLYSIKEQPDAIPYVTSFYERRWGFCVPHRLREALGPGPFDVWIDSTLAPGSLTYGELLLEGESSREVLLSTYVCHPSMANNELSGPVVTTALARWLMAQPRRRLSYRIVFVPETIGSIVYLSRHLEEMRRRTLAGFVLSCVGDERTYSYLPTRRGDTLTDRVARHVLKHHAGSFDAYSFLDRGSDERQYGAVGVDLPVALMMRSKFHTYPEYHTSLDDLSLITPRGLEGAYEAHRLALYVLEHNARWRTTTICEPQLGRRGLHPTLSTREGARRDVGVKGMRNLLAYADGRLDLVELAEAVGLAAWECVPLLKILEREGLVVRVEEGGARDELREALGE